MQRLAEVPGLGVDSAQQVIAEVGATAATFPSPKHLASWMGACPGNEESAGKNYSHRCLALPWGPVIAPVSIALLMIVWGTLASALRSIAR